MSKDDSASISHSATSVAQTTQKNTANPLAGSLPVPAQVHTKWFTHRPMMISKPAGAMTPAVSSPLAGVADNRAAAPTPVLDVKPQTEVTVGRKRRKLAAEEEEARDETASA